MITAITAIGTANPPHLHEQQTVANTIGQLLKLGLAKKRLLKSIYKSSGIESRYSVLANDQETTEQFTFIPNSVATSPSTATRMEIYRQNALPLAMAAIESCLATKENFAKQQITHLIIVSCTGMYAPGIDIEIIQKLNLNSTVKRTTIHFMGCYAAFNGIKAADAICKADPAAKALVVCVELCTIHLQHKEDMDNLIANAIFADGAAAVLIEANPEQNKYFSLEYFHCDLLPQSSKEMAWHIGNHGFDMVLTSYVPEAIKSGIASFFHKLIAQGKLTPELIDIYAIHPGGVKILQACEEALKISREKNNYSYETLRNFGNMSSATVLFVLKSIWDDIKKDSDDNKRIFSCAFGPGLTLESMLLSVRHCEAVV
ncbi:Alpha-pyrone synthesis polyketide synthase-like Pks18 [Legionella massiliensis]|uniref:Alpha-pyrone synthesis polyketide synthase-like Pks18 n=1 Tax=Legionella massiliensis TaxID=1034943 RepID=A0A078L0B3_9GAMM|nr:type III polyketide synthase [Legionella massiliensis]CDZ78596.1 Alpha-pyrone synthesis polyketide synthase-like Pks18 [Legionella massiliensis]CEE14334.1 Alpha-pyrone synthesis polyketide synthase-like Pks18 [Legionella massiliensis]